MAEMMSFRPSAASSSSAEASLGGGGGAGSAIQVVVRLRPMNENEKRQGTYPVVTAKTQEKSVMVIKGKGRKQLKSSYSFDNVFTAFSTQEEVFEATVKPVIIDVMRGFESTVFAYGQTGTGKTHTMEGSLGSPELYGVIPRSAQAIFEHLKQPQYKEHTVTCSYLEIYNEELRDLLVDGNGNGGSGAGQSQHNQHQKLDIMEGKSGTFCRGLTEKQVHSASDVLILMQEAAHSRMVGETKMNKSSSRSHCLFTIQVHGKISLLNGDGDMEFNGKLHMVDLAGSECAKSAGNDKGAPDAVARERERMNINRSLLTLGRVITVLKEKSLNKNTNARIPYRDSKLTRVLQESLGGRCKTVIIATLSPSITAIEESVSTLNYAHSANGIVNKPVSSSLIALGESMPSMGNGNGSPAQTIESWQEMECRLQYMQTQVDEAQAALARKHLQQQELQDRAEKAESELLECQHKLYDANKVIEAETNKRKQTEKELNETQIHLRKTELILKATQETESSLTLEAQTLIGKLEEILSDRNDMHALVVSQRDTESKRRKATKQFQEAAQSVLKNIESSFTDLSSSIEASRSSAIKIATLNNEVSRHSVSETQKLISDIAKNVSCVMESIKSQMAGEGGIVSTVKTSSNSVLSVLQSANYEFLKGEESFEESRESMRRRLDDCTKTLDERSSSIQASASQALQSFESKVVESKNAISYLVMRLKNSLSNLAEAKDEKAKALDSLVEQWRDQSLANSKTVLDATTSSSVTLKDSINEFQKGMLNHEEITKSLENQRSFLGGTGTAHVQTIDEQGSLLVAHRQKLAESHSTQTKIRNDVYKSIMLGVQALVKSEIEKLATTQTNHFQVLDKDGENLASTNERITQSAKSVMENLQSTNTLLTDKSSIACTNDLKASEVMSSTQHTLEGVMESSTTHHKLTTDFASKSLVTMSEMKQLDGQNSEVAKMAERDGKACSTSLVNAVFKPTSAVMKKTMQSSLDTKKTMRSSLDTISYELEGAAANRKSIANQTSNKLESARAQLSAMAGQVTSIAQTQHDVADRLRNETVDASNTHANESVPYYNAELDSSKDKLMNTMASLAETSTRAISEGKAQGSTVKQSVKDFAHNKMLCTKIVDPAPLRKECTFSHNMSSTPAEDEILKGVDFDSSQSEDLAASYAAVAATAARRSESPTHPDVDTSHESQDDDNASRKSSGSLSSLPSPRRSFTSHPRKEDSRPKFRDVNVKYDGDKSGPRPRNQHHHTASTSSSSTRKNKCPSGSRVSPRKRKKW